MTSEGIEPHWPARGETGGLTPPAKPRFPGPGTEPERVLPRGGGPEAGRRAVEAWPGMKPVPPLSPEVYDEFCRWTHRRFGIKLSPGHESFLIGRLYPVLQRSGCATPAEFLELLRADVSGMWESELANAITTQHTGFFRESEHFELLLTRVLPEIAERKRAAGDLDLRVWSAGCATGAEPYSLVMTLMAYFGFEYELWQAGTLATDISDAALAKARLGRFTTAQLEGVPPAYRHHFLAHDTDCWELSETVCREVTFRRFNLLETRMPFRRPFDVVFCRNVIIYFDTATRDALVDRFYQTIAPGGYLFIGHSETIDRARSRFECVRSSVYRRRL